MKILFLSANPDGTSHLHLDEEVKKIDECLRKSRLRDQFQFITKFAVDASTLRQALLEEDPDIIHFAGHGEGQAGLVLVGQDNKAKPATADALSALFKLFPKIKCVLLNACYAEEQAKAIVQHVGYVVGMKQAVRDDAAIAFAAGFYDGLGYGRSIDDAFDLGRSAIQFECASFSETTRKLIPVDLENVESLPDHLIPVLLKKEVGSTGSLISLTPSLSESNSLVEKLQKDDISEAEALKMYRIRVQEFLVDRKLTQIENVQLAILARVLGLSETDTNRVLQEEQDKQQDGSPTTATRQPQTTRIGTPKIIFACVVLLILLAGGFSIYSQTTIKYIQLQNLLKNKDWKSADDETARIMWTIADRQQERSLRAEDFEKIPCSDLRDIDELWETYSNKHFGFNVQRQIWSSSEVNSDLGKFVDHVGWGQRKEDGSFFYWSMDGQSFDLSIPAGKLPWGVTYYGGNNNTRERYMSKLTSCLP